MTDVKKALYAFWSQFGVPAYLRDQVPSEAELPYITYDVTTCGLMGAAILEAYNWHRDEAGGNLARTALMDKIAKAIPQGGRVLPAGDGFLHLHRNPAGFQADWQDANDPDVIGGRTSYEVYFYTL